MTWASVHVPHLLCPNQLRPAPLLPRVCGEAGTSLAVLTTNRLRPMLVSYRQLWVAKQNFSREYSTGRKVLGRGVSVRRTCLPSLRHRGRHAGRPACLPRCLRDGYKGSILISVSPFCTTSPFWATRATTRPAISDWISLKTFIASTRAMTWPTWTVSPRLTKGGVEGEGAE